MDRFSYVILFKSISDKMNLHLFLFPQRMSYRCLFFIVFSSAVGVFPPFSSFFLLFDDYFNSLSLVRAGTVTRPYGRVWEAR